MKTARQRWKTLKSIRQEKFNISLPVAMRENNVTMWIHSMREGNPDPLTIDLGGNKGFFVFTDVGGDRIERAVFGGYRYNLVELDCYDFFGQEEELKEYIIKKDPKVIAVNTSEWIPVADGISHSNYKKLIDLIGDKYSSRITSAEKLITDFRMIRIPKEIELYKEICEISRELLERALSNEVITPGVTSREDVGWWMEDQLASRGMKGTFELTRPHVIYSEVSKREDCWMKEYIIQRGDVLVYDFGIDFMNYGTDMKRTAYILKEGETKVPKGIQNGWNQAMKAREVITSSFHVGQTAGEALESIGNALTRAGFIYVPLKINPMLARSVSLDAPENPEDRKKTEISIDFHCIGNSGNSQVALGPAIAGFRQDRAHLIIKPNHIFAFEFIAYTPNPDWGWTKVKTSIEEDAIVTEKGVEWLYSPNTQILLIH